MNENFVHRSSSVLASLEHRTPRHCLRASSFWALRPCRRWRASINARYAYKDCLRTPSSNPDAVPEVHTSFQWTAFGHVSPQCCQKKKCYNAQTKGIPDLFRSSLALIAVCSLPNEQPMPPFLKSRQESEALAANISRAAGIHCQS
jgi:hypothetical protein